MTKQQSGPKDLVQKVNSLRKGKPGLDEERIDAEVDFDSGDEMPNASETEAADSPLHAPQDLRFGGEDVSGMSEWSMRAHSPELDDGLDAGDFKRSDGEILGELWDTLGQKTQDIKGLDITVEAGEVYLRGTTTNGNTREWIEELLLDIPGVKEVHDEIILAK